jgi:AraC-like DNA-binding protein
MTGQVVSTKDDARFTSWQFNREFYCIIDHDEEVSCVGLLFYGGSELAILRFDASESHKFDLLTQVFEDEFGNHDNIQGEMLQMLLKRLIIKLTRIRKDHPDAGSLGGEDLDIIRQFNLLVEKNYRQIHQVQAYAELMHRSPKTLSNAFSAYKNTTPLQIIHERLILEAQRLLLYSNKPVKEIAYDLGFDEVSHFNRMFKKFHKVSPGAFRKDAALTSD